jgi:hypothetical protein
MNFTTGCCGEEAGTVTAVIVAVIEEAVLISRAATGPVGPGGPAAPVAPADPAGPSAPVLPVQALKTAVAATSAATARKRAVTRLFDLTAFIAAPRICLGKDRATPGCCTWASFDTTGQTVRSIYVFSAMK